MDPTKSKGHIPVYLGQIVSGKGACGINKNGVTRSQRWGKKTIPGSIVFSSTVVTPEGRLLERGVRGSSLLWANVCANGQPKYSG